MLLNQGVAQQDRKQTGAAADTYSLYSTAPVQPVSLRQFCGRRDGLLRLIHGMS